MDWKEFFDFLKYFIGSITIIVIVYMVLNSGFKLNTFKLDYKDLINIEVSGSVVSETNVSGEKVSENEKNTQPR